jgi:predicted Rossmann-fold nucleotide-binding protein
MIPTNQPNARPTLAVFASDKGPGDAERSSIMSQVGTYFARKGARIVCLAEGRSIAIPLVTSARAVGGEIVVIGDEEFTLPRALSGVPLELFPDPAARHERVAALADAFIGLPGSLGSITDLYQSWLKAGGGAGGKPVVLYNRNNAFGVLKGFAFDVMAHSVRHHDRFIQIADSVEDLWNRASRLVG